VGFSSSNIAETCRFVVPWIRVSATVLPSDRGTPALRRDTRSEARRLSLRRLGVGDGTFEHWDASDRYTSTLDTAPYVGATKIHAAM
jgi:hypothetical protein